MVIVCLRFEWAPIVKYHTEGFFFSFPFIIDSISIQNLNVWQRFAALKAMHKQRVFFLSAIRIKNHVHCSNGHSHSKLMLCSFEMMTLIGSRKYRWQWLCRCVFLFLSLSLSLPPYSRKLINKNIDQRNWTNLNYIIHKHLFIWYSTIAYSVI